MTLEINIDIFVYIIQPLIGYEVSGIGNFSRTLEYLPSMGRRTPELHPLRLIDNIEHGLLGQSECRKARVRMGQC